jgi:hypothetical protein
LQVPLDKLELPTFPEDRIFHVSLGWAAGDFEEQKLPTLVEQDLEFQRLNTCILRVGELDHVFDLP